MKTRPHLLLTAALVLGAAVAFTGCATPSGAALPGAEASGSERSDDPLAEEGDEADDATMAAALEENIGERQQSKLVCYTHRKIGSMISRRVCIHREDMELGREATVRQLRDTTLRHGKRTQPPAQ